MPSSATKIIQLADQSERRFRHEVSLRHESGALDLDVSFTLDAPWTAIFAPSGAGKTTILRMIAGLDQPNSGRIISFVDRPPDPQREAVLLDTAHGICVPTHKRVMRMVTQRPSLFPHLSVLRNILYRNIKPTREELELANEQAFEELLQLCRVAHLRDKMPHQLSGGERQRVALARALSGGGRRLLMLDEPFTGLEADLRDALIQDLRAWLHQRGTPVLLVTHDLGEVFAAQAQVLKMESGRIVASGPAHEVLSDERARLLQRLTEPGAPSSVDSFTVGPRG